MSTKTLFGMANSVKNKLGPAGEGVSMGEVYEALFNANRWIHGRYDWNWQLGQYKVNIKGTYGTGTISATDGTTAVTGSGTTWDVTWTNKRLFVGTRNTSYAIASINSPTSLTLESALNIGGNLTDAGYSIFQDTYDLPSDFEPGQDVALFNPLLRMQVRKIPRESLEQQNVIVQTMFTTVTWAYTDAGFNTTTKRYTIKVLPPPSTDSELNLIYRKAPIDIVNATDQTQIPESFATILEFKAEAELRRSEGIPGAVQAEAEANQLLRAMKRRQDRQNITNRPSDHGVGVPDSSASWNGLSMLPGWRT